jgi:hypothetical protein
VYRRGNALPSALLGALVLVAVCLAPAVAIVPYHTLLRDQAIVFYPVVTVPDPYNAHVRNGAKLLIAAVAAAAKRMTFVHAVANFYVSRTAISQDTKQGESCPCTDDVLLSEFFNSTGAFRSEWYFDFAPCPTVLKLGTELVMVSDGPTREYKVCVQYLIPPLPITPRTKRGVMLESENEPQVPLTDRYGQHVKINAPLVGVDPKNDPNCVRPSRYRPYFGEHMEYIPAAAPGTPRTHIGCLWDGTSRAWANVPRPAAADADRSATPDQLLNWMLGHGVPAAPPNAVNAAAGHPDFENKWSAAHGFDAATQYAVNVPQQNERSYIITVRRAHLNNDWNLKAKTAISQLNTMHACMQLASSIVPREAFNMFPSPSLLAPFVLCVLTCVSVCVSVVGAQPHEVAYRLLALWNNVCVDGAPGAADQCPYSVGQDQHCGGSYNYAHLIARSFDAPPGPGAGGRAVQVDTLQANPPGVAPVDHLPGAPLAGVGPVPVAQDVVANLVLSTIFTNVQMHVMEKWITMMVTPATSGKDVILTGGPTPRVTSQTVSLTVIARPLCDNVPAAGGRGWPLW